MDDRAHDTTSVLEPSAARPEARIRLVAGSLLGTEFVLRGASLLLGRSASADLKFDDASDFLVSGRHARLVLAHDGWHIEDLGSKNGTFVNGAPADAGKVLASDDEVCLGPPGASGGCAFTLVLPETTGSGPPKVRARCPWCAHRGGDAASPCTACLLPREIQGMGEELADVLDIREAYARVDGVDEPKGGRHLGLWRRLIARCSRTHATREAGRELADAAADLRDELTRLLRRDDHFAERVAHAVGGSNDEARGVRAVLVVLRGKLAAKRGALEDRGVMRALDHAVAARARLVATLGTRDR